MGHGVVARQQAQDILAKDGEAVCEIRLSEVDGALLVGVYPAKAYHIRAHQFSWTPLASTKLDELVRPYI